MSVRAFLAETLERAGFAVEQAETGAEGLRLAADHPDLIVLDLQVGKMGGMATCMDLRLEEGAVMGATRARANRLANADHANLVRTSRSARRQLAAVERLRANDLAGLPDRLREAAELRLRHPTASLRELAARADPPATKAAMHRRLRRLVELAE